jgi:hypothetical protein
MAQTAWLYIRKARRAIVRCRRAGRSPGTIHRNSKTSHVNIDSCSLTNENAAMISVVRHRELKCLHEDGGAARAIPHFPSTAGRLPSTPEAIHHAASTEPRTPVRGPLGLPSATALLFSSSSRGVQRGVEPRRKRTALFIRGSVPAGRSARGGIGLQIR